MKTPAKRFFLLVLAAAMVLPLFCVAPAVAAEEAADSTLSACPGHDFFLKRYPEEDDYYPGPNGHQKYEVSYPTCMHCGYIDTSEGSKIVTWYDEEEHSFSAWHFDRSDHTGSYKNHSWIYYRVCYFCRYYDAEYEHCPCTVKYCVPDPQAVKPEIM